MTRVMRRGKLLSTTAKSLYLHVIAGGLYSMVRVPLPHLFFNSFFSLANCGGAFPPPLLLQQLDAVVDVKLDCPPVSLVAHQQGTEFEAALAVRLRGDAQLHEVSLQVSLHCYTLRLRPGTLQYTTLACEKDGVLQNVNKLSSTEDSRSIRMLMTDGYLIWVEYIASYGRWLSTG